MKEWLTFVTENVVVIINGMAVVVIAIGTFEAFLRSFRAIFSWSQTGDQFRSAYVRYARWLVAGLTFLLAADIIALSITPSWHDVGIVAAISGIRTFLSFFLERDLAEAERNEAELHGVLAASR
jgi:uncharacterized membrane protein